MLSSRMGTRKESVQADPYSGPYKATRLWNDVILAFRENVPCGRHRRFMKSFDNCFSGSSATDWLLQYLKSNRNFGSDVKREKAVSLLNKLYNAGIFEEVKVSKTMQHKTVVQDHRLYRLLPVSPSKLKMTRLPLAPRNDVTLSHTALNSVYKKNESKKDKTKASEPPRKVKLKTVSISNISQNAEESKKKYPACRIVPKVLSSSEIRDVWKRTFIYRLKKSLGVTRITDVFSEDLIDGSFVMHNCLYVNKNGTVTNIAASDQLPQWVLSAMKCLARWPEHHEEGLPSYPGFEKDVFAVVKNYYLGLEKPLIPFQFYDAITNIFVMVSSRSSRRSEENHSSKDRESIIKNLWTTASLENIILDLSKKYSLLGATGHQFENESFHENFSTECAETHDNVPFVCSNDKEVFANNYNVASEDSFFKSRNHRRRPHHRQQLSRSVHSTSGLLQQRKCNTLPLRKFGSTPNLKISKYETAFGPDNRTVTRVFYQNGVCTDYEHCEEEEEHNSFSPIETHFSASAEDLVHLDHPVNFERVGSLELVNIYGSQNNIGNSNNQGNVQRSKSFASRPRSDNNDDGFSYFSRSKGVDKFKSLQRRSGDLYGFSQSVEDEPEYLWASQDSLITNDRLHPVSECENGATQSRHNSFTARCTNTGSVHSLHQNNSFYQTSAYPRQCNLSRNSIKDGHECVKHVDSRCLPPFQSLTSLHSYKDSPCDYSPSYGPGYRPVLDASKERSFSTANLSPKSSNSTRTKSLSILNEDYHMTSTPLSLPHSNEGSSNFGGRLQSGISLSSLTPFYGSDGARKHVSTTTSDFICYPQTRLSEERAKNCLQLFTLLMPPGNRRKLHMLFKMMVKMTANPNLCLDSTQTTRSLVLGVFYRSIIRSEKDCDMDEMLVLQLLSFMLDYYDDIFTPPNDLNTQVSERLKEMQKPQVSYSPGQPVPLQYCQKKSVAAFEHERDVILRQAMEELLDNIVKDTKMPSKEKHKRLKQFQVTYPTIYKKRFPTPESEDEVLQVASKPKLKPPLVVRPMNRLKGLRL